MKGLNSITICFNLEIKKATYFENTDSDKIFSRSKSLGKKNFWSDIILVTSPKISDFCLTKFCPIRYF